MCHIIIIEKLRIKEVDSVKVDRVCGMNVDEKKPGATYEYKGETYYFCAKACKNKFSQDPEKYIKGNK
jgi:YHS domain-containing protein